MHTYIQSRHLEHERQVQKGVLPRRLAPARLAAHEVRQRALEVAVVVVVLEWRYVGMYGE